MQFWRGDARVPDASRGDRTSGDLYGEMKEDKTPCTNRGRITWASPAHNAKKQDPGL
jgi:hypothetical protein